MQFHVYVSWETTERDTRLGSGGARQIRPIIVKANTATEAKKAAKKHVANAHPWIPMARMATEIKKTSD